MKKLSLLIISIFISLAFIKNIDALTGYTRESDIMVRTGPSTSYDYVAQLEANYVLDLVDSTLYNVGDSACSIGWYKINFNGNERYICGEYVTIGDISSSTPSYSTDPYDARIYGTSIQVRSAATSTSTLKTYLMPGDDIVIKSGKISGSGCSDGWYQVAYYKNETGYVCSTYIRTKSEITATEPEYEKELKEKGFPDTYIPYLVKLHQMHPAWVFNPSFTNYNWNYVVERERDANVLNYIYVNNTTQNVYTKYMTEEYGWYRTTDAVNAFYLDPRNFLTEKFVFMFEKLNYDYGNDSKTVFNKESESAKKYYKDLQSILAGTYLNADNYIYAFIESGFKYNISPDHIASRAIQEGMGRPTNESITGEYTGTYFGHSLYGYYNYYNINAYYSNGYDPTTNGLAYACGSECGYSNTYLRPWNTREKAIEGGAMWIAEDYIGIGQHTLYYQKFNTSPLAESRMHFAHQYQTNVQAPVTEGVSVFEAYRDSNQLNNKIEFDIPIYNNMPDVVSLPKIANTVNTLKDIKINGVSIHNFDKDVLEYITYISDKESKVKIEVTKSDNTSTVTGDGEITLTNDETKIQIKVTAENGSLKIYTVTIKKVTDNITIDEIISNLSTKQTNGIMYKISPNTLGSTLKNSILKFASNATVKITNVTGNEIETNETLKTGQTLTITVPSGETRSFKLAVIGDTNSDGKVDIIDLLQIQKYILKAKTLDNENLKAGDTNDDGKVDIIDLLRIQKYILKKITL